MKTTETLESVNSIHSPLSQQDMTPEVDVRPLTPEDASTYMDLLRRNEQRMSRPEHKLFLLAMYGDESGLIRTLEKEGSDNRNGIWVNGQLAGGIDTTPTTTENTEEVSYWLDKDSTRKGVGHAALQLLIERKDREGQNLEATVESENYASMNLLEKNGFRERPMKYAGQYRFGRQARPPKQE